MRRNKIALWMVLVASAMCCSCAPQNPAQPGAAVAHSQRAAVTVEVSLPGATTREMETLCVPWWEECARSVKGGGQTVARCEAGRCSILVSGAPADGADALALRVGAAVDEWAAELPEAATVTVHKGSPLRAYDAVLGLLYADDDAAYQHSALLEPFAATVVDLPEVQRCMLAHDRTTPELHIDFDHDRLAQLGLNAADAMAFVKNAMDGTPSQANQLGELVLTTPSGEFVPVTAVARFRMEAAPHRIHKINGRPAGLIYVVLRTGHSPTGHEAFRRSIAQIDLPQGVSSVLLVGDGSAPLRSTESPPDRQPKKP